MSKKASSSLQSSKKRSTKARRKRSLIEAQTPFEILCGEPERINPAILLAEEIMRQQLGETIDFDDIRRVEETINASRFEIGRVEMQFVSLVKTPAFAGTKIPVGF